MTENYDLTMERTYPAPPRAVYDAFLGMYGENRPDWIVESHLDPRPGGSWRVVFHPPGLEAFTEDRVLSAVEPPHRLAYSMTGFPDAATRDDFAGGWSGVWDGLTPGEHDPGSAG